MVDMVTDGPVGARALVDRSQDPPHGRGTPTAAPVDGRSPASFGTEEPMLRAFRCESSLVKSSPPSRLRASPGEVVYARRRRRAIGSVALSALVLALVGVFAFRHVLLEGSKGAESLVVPAPGRDYAAVVYEDADWVDPVWRVFVRQTGALGSTEWRVGCLSGDVPGDEFKSLRWIEDDLLVISSHRDQVRVSVNSASGEPASTVSPIWTC